MSQKNTFPSWAALISSVTETLEQRQIREEAQANSARIDEELKAARDSVVKNVKVLVLGQSESGASHPVSLFRIPC